MNISKFSNDAEKPFHTHEFAQAANGTSMGATSAQSFQQRSRIDQNRRVIQRYRDSAVGKGSRLREELYQRMDNPDADNKHDKHHKYKLDRQGFNARESGSPNSAPSAKAKPAQQMRRNFSEPSTRHYNPFS